MVHLACSRRTLQQEHSGWKFDLMMNYCWVSTKIFAGIQCLLDTASPSDVDWDWTFVVDDFQAMVLLERQEEMLCRSRSNHCARLQSIDKWCRPASKEEIGLCVTQQFIHCFLPFNCPKSKNSYWWVDNANLCQAGCYTTQIRMRCRSVRKGNIAFGNAFPDFLCFAF